MNELVRARSTDPETSHLAAAAARELARQHSTLILMCLNRHGPLGKDGISRHTGIDGVAVCRRLPELERDGLARPTGNNVTSDSGRLEREWAVTSSNTNADRILAHLVRMAKVDKHYAWWAAKNYARLNPHECSDMPERLTAHMLKLKEES